MNRRTNSFNFPQLMALLRNPSSALSLRGAEDAPLGILGFVVSVGGFFLWILSIQHQIRESLPFVTRIFLGSLLQFSTGLRFLFIALLSLGALVASLSVIGNYLGSRKRSWIEVLTCQGASQLLFGTGYIVSAILAFLSQKLSYGLTGGLLLLSLLTLFIQALEMHDLDRRQSFLFVAGSMLVYIVIFSIVWLIIF